MRVGTLPQGDRVMGADATQDRPVRAVRARPQTIDADQGMTEIEAEFRRVADPFWKAEALGVLRRWAADPTLGDASRERAKGLVWSFSPNGWDEV